MNTANEDKELVRQLGNLPRELAPKNDVWAAILARIESEQVPRTHSVTRQRWRGLGIAAGFLVAFAAGLVVGPRLLSPPPVTDGIARAPTGESDYAFGTGLSATLAATEMEYQAAFREFMSIGGPKTNLPAGTVDTLMKSWDELRQSESGLMAALQDNPDSLFLNTRMMELRSRQLQFLKQVAALDHGSRRTSI